MCRNIKANVDIYLAILLIIMSIGILIFPMENNSETKGALVGALISGATLLFGNWVNRHNDRSLVEEEIEGRQVKLKALIAPELVNILGKLIYAKNYLEEDWIAVKANEGAEGVIDWPPSFPMAMLSLEYLGVELLILEEHAIDSLTKLRISLEEMRRHMDLVRPDSNYSRFVIESLLKDIKSNMENLLKSFEHIAPTLPWKSIYQPEELIIKILRQEIESLRK